MHVRVAIQIGVQRDDASDLSLSGRGANGDLEGFKSEGAVLGASIVQEPAYRFAGSLNEGGGRDSGRQRRGRSASRSWASVETRL